VIVAGGGAGAVSRPQLGRYSFQLPDLPSSLRLLRDPHATDEE
jgi:hypothetical protein